MNVVDFVSDWLLFIDVSLLQDGLVYGPVEKSVLYALLAFSIVGTLTFTFEVLNFWYEVFRNNAWMDSELASAITIWVEDLPQIVINVYIAWCREDAISVFQLVKASITLLGKISRFHG